MTTADDLKIGSAFSGVGGLDLGVLAALGGRVVWHAETDLRAQTVLSRHWPDTPNLGDVRTVDWSSVEPVDVLTAGFPCQDLSVAGPRTGLAPGTRSGLWQHVVHATSILRPSLLVIENVRGILSTRTTPYPRSSPRAVRDVDVCPRHLGDAERLPPLRALGAVLGSLADLGYDSAWTCVRASDVGSPHQRARIFLTARPTPQDPHREPRHQRRHPAPHQTQGRRPRPHPGRRGRTPAAHAESERRSEGVTESALPQRRPHPRLHRSQPHPAERPEPNCPDARTATAHPDPLRRQRRRGHHPQTQGRHEPPHRRHSPPEWWADYHRAIHRWEHLTGTPAPPPTQPGTRRLSAHLVEWMMGLPTGWVTNTDGLTRAAQLHLLGNSVVPQQAAHALEALLVRWGEDRGYVRREDGQ
ncbi:DNA cytosine methyltransferase [Streptomyces sp. NPDC051561]|uniref:DNA cytosine methyltransferase n=1 Tax=Streptomyces sp. NPDC051561 TaxID=3365658 RepID=UPI00378C5F33